MVASVFDKTQVKSESNDKNYHSLSAHHSKVHGILGPRSNPTEEIIELESVGSEVKLRLTGKISKRPKRKREGWRFCSFNHEV